MDQISQTPEKAKLFKALFVVFVLLAVFLGAETLNAIKEYSHIGTVPTSTNAISVSGTGEVFAVPDIATFSFSVVESGKTVKEAQDKASVKINAAIDAVKKMGVAEKDIKTTGYYSNPKYDYTTYPCAEPMMMNSGGSSVSNIAYPCRSGKQVLTGYEVSQSISVKVRKTDDAGAILTKVGGLGVQNISGLDFVIDNIDAVQAEARDKAIQDAKAKAQVLAKSLGVKLSKIVSFSEGGNQPIYYAMETKGMMGASAAPIPQIPTGENKVTSNVTITYEIQ
ncbi:MAG TPA: SIMPL domain-containing protein [Candidatus Paceibacterota bacterium]